MTLYAPPARPQPYGAILRPTTTPPTPEPDMIQPIPRDQILDVLTWLRGEVYPGLVGHALDDEGIAAWAIDAYVSVGRYRLGLSHQAAKEYTFREIEKVVGAPAPRPPPTPGEPSPGLRGDFRIDGRSFADDDGPDFPCWAGALYGLARGDAMMGQLEEYRALGVGGVRFFGGDLSSNPNGVDQRAEDAATLYATVWRDRCRALDLRVEATALTNTQGWGFDRMQRVVQLWAQANPDALELINEWQHESQRPTSREELLELQAIARAAGYRGPIALGAAKVDELDKPANQGGRYPARGGSYCTVHRNRNKGPQFYVDVNRLTEQRAIREVEGVPVCDNEGKRLEEYDAPMSAAFLQGVLSRSFGLATVLHGAQMREARGLDDVGREGVRSLVRGHQILKRSRGVPRFSAGHHGDSPISKAAYVEGTGAYVKPGKHLWRAQSFLVSDTEGICVLSGPNVAEGERTAEWRDGWGSVGVADEMPMVRVLEINRG